MTHLQNICEPSTINELYMRLVIQNTGQFIFPKHIATEDKLIMSKQQ